MTQLSYIVRRSVQIGISMKRKTKTMIALAAITTTTIHVINKIQYARYAETDFLSETENFYYEWRFGKVCYTKTGKGSPILLIHDLSVGSSGHEFRKLMDSLAQSHEVYTLDLLGYGSSDKPNMTYTNFLYVQLVTDFIKNVIGKKTNVVTSGDSSSIAAMVAHNDPEVISNLIFINPENLYHCNQIPSKQTKMLKFFIELPIFGTFVFNLFTTRAYFENVFENKYFDNINNIEEKDILSYLESSHKKGYSDKYSYASYLSNYMNANIVHALKEINNSILIIAGEKKEESETIVENYIYYNNSIETTYIKNTKQLPHLEKPEEVLEQLSTFL